MLGGVHMEELINKLEILVKIRNAISSTYSEICDSEAYYECMEMINDLEKGIISAIKEV